VKQSPADVVINKFGGVVNTANALNISHSSVSMWKQRGGHIPQKYLTKIKYILGRKITYKELMIGSKT